MSVAEYKAEHVRPTPRGWKVRTALSGRHRVRIAFPPGARRKGSGEVVEILHPKGENPCSLDARRAAAIAAKFPGELPHGARNDRYSEMPPILRRYARRRMAFQYLRPGEHEDDKAAMRRALKKLRQAERTSTSKWRNRRKNSAELLILGNPQRERNVGRASDKISDWKSAMADGMFANYRSMRRSGQSKSQAAQKAIRESLAGPAAQKLFLKWVRRDRENSRRERNPGETRRAEAMYEKFHGRSPKEILEIQESAAMRSDYAGLGDLIYLVVRDGGKPDKQIDFSAADRVKVAANADGTQIYFIGGNQNVGASLGEFACDTSKDFCDLGECRQICYRTQKKFDRFETIDYYHRFGEEGGALPILIYNKIAKRLLLAGGDYKIEAPGITG